MGKLCNYVVESFGVARDSVAYLMYRDHILRVPFHETLGILLQPYTHVRFSNGAEQVFDMRREHDCGLLTTYLDYSLDDLITLCEVSRTEARSLRQKMKLQAAA